MSGCAQALRDRLARAPPTWRAPWRAWRSAAAARAISRRCATRSARRLRCAGRSRRMAPLPSMHRRSRARSRRALVRWSSGLAARSRPTCRFWRATAASSRRDISPELDELRPAARRQPPAGRRAAGALRRRDRHRRAQDPPQQRARLSHRGDGRTTRRKLGTGFIHRQTWPTRCASPPSSWASSRAKIASAADRALALELETVRRPGRARRWRAPSRFARGGGAGRARRRGGAGRAGGRPSAMCRPVDRRLAATSPSTAGAIRWSRRRCGAATARPSSPTIATLAIGPAASGCSPAPTWRARAPSCARTR